MSVLIDTLEQRRNALVEDMVKVAQSATAEGRSLDGQTLESFDKMQSEVDGIDQRLKSIREGEQRARDIEASFKTNDDGKRGASDGAFGKWARESRNGDSFDVQTVRGAERRAQVMFRNAEQRAMSAAGGVSADGVYGQLWEYAVASSQILQAGVDIITTQDGNTLPLPVVTAHATGASAAANAPITASDSAIGLVNLGATKYGYLTLVPSELFQDATFDLEGYISRNAGRQLGKIISTVASTKLQAGFTVSGAVGPGAAASGTFGNATAVGGGADTIYDLFHSVLPEYRSTASFLMADPTAAAIRKIKDSTGQYIWQPALTAGDPDLLVGKSIYIDPGLPTFTGTPATDSGKKVLYFGDFAALKVRIAGGIRFERSNEYAFGNDQVAFRALVRTDAAVVDVNAVKFLQLG